MATMDAWTMMAQRLRNKATDVFDGVELHDAGRGQGDPKVVAFALLARTVMYRSAPFASPSGTSGFRSEANGSYWRK